MSRRSWIVGAVVLALVAGGALYLANRPPKPIAKPALVRMGSADFAESTMLAELYSVVLEAQGIPVERTYGIGVRDQYLDEMRNGVIDMAPEYIGSLTENLNQRANGLDAPAKASGDVTATMTALRELLATTVGVVADPSAAQNMNSFAVRQTDAKHYDWSTLSDLNERDSKMAMGGPVSCPESQFCLPGLEETYGLDFKEFEKLDAGGPKTLNALQSGDVDVALVFSSDPAVDERDLKILKDDKELQVAENVTALMRSEIAAPEVLAAIGSVNAALTTDELRSMNGQVSIKGVSAKWVAVDWAAKHGLVPAESVPEKPEPTPVKTPEPAPAPVSYNKNRGEPSSEAKSQNWPALAECESGGDPDVISGNGLYHGLYQFSASTWQAVGGSGVASDAKSDEQTYRAQILWDQSGPGQWPHCGKNL